MAGVWHKNPVRASHGDQRRHGLVIFNVSSKVCRVRPPLRLYCASAVRNRTLPISGRLLFVVEDCELHSQPPCSEEQSCRLEEEEPNTISSSETPAVSASAASAAHANIEVVQSRGCVATSLTHRSYNRRIVEH